MNLSNEDYPVTRCQAARWLRLGQCLHVPFQGLELPLYFMLTWLNLRKIVWVRIIARPGNTSLAIGWKQLLNFIRRTYPRSYEAISSTAEFAGPRRIN